MHPVLWVVFLGANNNNFNNNPSSVPVVSEEPAPYYSNCYYSSGEDSPCWEEDQFWATDMPHQECSIIKTKGFEGNYYEPKTWHHFTYTFFPGLIQPIRVYRAHRCNPYLYSGNPNYQLSLHPLYYHRLLTESEIEANKRKSPNVLQLYIKPEFNLWARVPKLTSVLTHTKISQILFYTLDRSIFAATVFQLEENRPIPIKIIERPRIKHLHIKKIASHAEGWSHTPPPYNH
jgi:hypothetical protein